jgi:murein tripeptide amidase MpaA
MGTDQIGKSGVSKPSIWIDGGIHAREWLSPAVMAYFIGRLTRDYASDTRIRRLVDSVDWYLMPVINADGYVYTWTQVQILTSTVLIAELRIACGVKTDHRKHASAVHSPASVVVVWI